METRHQEVAVKGLQEISRAEMQQRIKKKKKRESKDFILDCGIEIYFPRNVC